MSEKPELKRIPRNHKKKISEIAKTFTQCKTYNTGNYFNGEVCDFQHAWNAFDKFDFAKLIHNVDKGTYTISIHDNQWYELREAKV